MLASISAVCPTSANGHRADHRTPKTNTSPISATQNLRNSGRTALDVSFASWLMGDGERGVPRRRMGHPTGDDHGENMFGVRTTARGDRAGIPGAMRAVPEPGRTARSTGRPRRLHRRRWVQWDRGPTRGRRDVGRRADQRREGGVGAGAGVSKRHQMTLSLRRNRPGCVALAKPIRPIVPRRDEQVNQSTVRTTSSTSQAARASQPSDSLTRVKTCQLCPAEPSGSQIGLFPPFELGDQPLEDVVAPDWV